MKSHFNSIDNKLDTIVSLCNISTSSHSVLNKLTPVNIPVNPVTKPPTLLPHYNIPESPVQKNTRHSNSNTQKVQRPLIATHTQTLPSYQPSINYNNSNAINCNEFASAMGKVN